MRFSQRQGITATEKFAQIDSMDTDLRNSLWSALTIFYWNSFKGQSDDIYGDSNKIKGSNLSQLITCLWLHFFKKPVDSIEDYWPHCLQEIRNTFFKFKWYEVYDFIEYVVAYGPREHQKNFTEITNSYLERENSGYRIINKKFAPITSQEEADEVESAIADCDQFQGVKTHLTSALSLMSNREKPDYRNSIKESISAVESLSKQISNDQSGTLGSVLKDLEKNKKLHPALKNAFSSLYGYTNDADGIRHALMDVTNLTKADARFMLVCCSAFINYYIEGTKSK